MHIRRPQRLIDAIWRLYENSGFAMAGAVAFSFVVSLFPFCIFLGAIAGLVGGRELAQQAIDQLFEILPNRVAEGLAPEVDRVMGQSRVDLLTVSAGVALFFATSAIETMRTALNVAYRVEEKRSYPLCLLISMLFVFVTAIVSLVLTWAVVAGPGIAARITPESLRYLLDATWLSAGTRYAIAGVVIILQLFAFHIWLAAGRRTLAEAWPGVLLSTVLWLIAAGLYSRYLDLNDYTRFYAGLSQLMVALIFFQLTAAIIILGAELNRGIIELKKLQANGELGGNA
jgi:membrane protein